MLSPDHLEEAGDAVAAVYTDIESQMLDHLVSAIVSGEPITSKTTTELLLLSQTHDAGLRRIVTDNRSAIDAAVLETAERFLRLSDQDDIARAGGSSKYPQQIEATVTGMATVLARDNLNMVQGAKDAFLTASIEAVTKANSGLFTAEQAIHGAVRKLERDGISVISYRNAVTGIQTVKNKLDVAVRRHVRTQIAQDGARMTLERMAELDVQLVEVSSHADSRPEHADWQGRCYSLKGDVIIENTRYPDFYQATQYGSVTGLCGANCRHAFGPYRHGAPRTYSPDPKHASGLPGEEVYAYEQKQRYLERQIRADKREVRGMEQLYKADPSLANKTALLKAQKALSGRQETLRNLIKEANAKAKPGTTVLTRNARREWAGDMPAATKLAASHRKLDDFLTSKQAQLKSSGISKTRMKAAISSEMAKRGATAKDFASLTASEQQGIFARLWNEIDAKLPSTKKANAGKHAAYPKIQGQHSIKKDAKASNPGYDPGNFERSYNCQRTVNAYVMRRKGYDVIAKGINKEDFENDELAFQAWKAFDGAEIGFHSSQASAEASMAAWGDGAIAIIKVNWNGEGAHYFIAEQSKGKTVFIDPQDGTIDAERHFEAAKPLFFMSRVDNLEPSDLMKDAIEARV